MSDQKPKVVIVKQGSGCGSCLLLAILLTLLFGGGWIFLPLIVGIGGLAGTIKPVATGNRTDGSYRTNVPVAVAETVATPAPVAVATPRAAATLVPGPAVTPVPRRVGPVSVGAWAEVVRERSWTTEAGISRLRKGRMVFVRAIEGDRATVDLGDRSVQVELADLK